MIILTSIVVIIMLMLAVSSTLLWKRRRHNHIAVAAGDAHIFKNPLYYAPGDGVKGKSNA